MNEFDTHTHTHNMDLEELLTEAISSHPDYIPGKELIITTTTRNMEKQEEEEIKKEREERARKAREAKARKAKAKKEADNKEAMIEAEAKARVAAALVKAKKTSEEEELATATLTSLNKKRPWLNVEISRVSDMAVDLNEVKKRVERLTSVVRDIEEIRKNNTTYEEEYLAYNSFMNYVNSKLVVEREDPKTTKQKEFLKLHNIVLPHGYSLQAEVTFNPEMVEKSDAAIRMEFSLDKPDDTFPKLIFELSIRHHAFGFMLGSVEWIGSTLLNDCLEIKTPCRLFEYAEKLKNVTTAYKIKTLATNPKYKICFQLMETLIKMIKSNDEIKVLHLIELFNNTT